MITLAGGAKILLRGNKKMNRTEDSLSLKMENESLRKKFKLSLLLRLAHRCMSWACVSDFQFWKFDNQTLNLQHTEELTLKL